MHIGESSHVAHSGRLVAGYFEKLIPREGNADYYKNIRMPISLETIEEKLENGDFRTLAELESYCKRMIANAKEYYPRSSSTFEDAERVRKALSNYMTKTNPAYSQRGYQALPTELPPEDGEVAGAAEDEDEEAGEEDGEDGEDQDDDAEGEEQEEDEDYGSRRRSIILKRRETSRTSRHSSSLAQDSPSVSLPSARPDHQYENVPYKGLSFQQAQEKVVEEMLRHTEPE